PHVSCGPGGPTLAQSPWNQSLMTKYAMAVKQLMILLPIMLGALSLRAQEPPVIDPRLPQEQTWEIMPATVGLGGVPAPALELRFNEPVRHDPANVIEIVVESMEPIDLLPVLLLENDKREVLAARRGGGLESNRLLWSIDDRLGNPPGIAGLSIAATQNDQPVSTTITSIRVLNAEDLSDSELIKASYYAPLSVA